jgi:hypothetical protein
MVPGFKDHYFMNSENFTPMDIPVSGGFLFSTFRGYEETPMCEQVYFGISENGRDWQVLHGGEPILISEIGEKGARDPFLVRSPEDSRYWIIATDLSAHLNGDWERAATRGSRSLLVWESTDLMNWSGPRLVDLGLPDAGCAWAPEAIWDNARGQFLVYWASTTARDGFAKQRVWAATTRDFQHFSEPFVWIEKSNHVIDTDVVYDNGRYYRFSKDDEYKNITCETSSDLLGEWQPVSGFSLGHLENVEGPLCFALGDGTWCLLLDFYMERQGYKPFVSRDLASGHWEPAAGDFSFPFPFRHGGVLPVSAKELEQLKAAL